MKKLTYKRFFYNLLLLTILFIVSMAAILFWKDPYYQYRVPDDDNIYLYDESFQNAGMLKNYDYDTLIIGSSMAENFKKSWFDEMFSCNSYKAPFRGAWSTEMSMALQVAFQHQDLENVFIGLDIWMLMRDSSKPKYELPEYLYDDNYLNDLQYLLNKTAFLKGIPASTRKGNLDEAFAWGYKENMIFSKEKVLETFEQDRTVRDKEKDKDDDFYHEIMMQNLANFTYHIENNKDTVFNIFLPPYSILYWYENNLKGLANAQLDMVEDALKLLMKYENVKIYYFQNEDFILNLDYYKDITHYSPNVSYHIVDSMAQGKNQLTLNTVHDEINKLRSMMESYEYRNK